jgi:hypothetical protein
LIIDGKKENHYQPKLEQIHTMVDLICFRKLKIEDTWLFVRKAVGENGETLLSLLIKEDENKQVDTLDLEKLVTLFPWEVNGDLIVSLTIERMSQGRITLEAVPEQIRAQRTPKGNSLFAALKENGLLSQFLFIELTDYFNIGVFGSELALYIAEKIINGTIKIDSKMIPPVFRNNTITVGDSGQTLLSYLLNDNIFSLKLIDKYPADDLEIIFTDDSNCINQIKQKQQEMQVLNCKDKIRENPGFINEITDDRLLSKVIEYAFSFKDLYRDFFGDIRITTLNKAKKHISSLEIIDYIFFSILPEVSTRYSKEELARSVFNKPLKQVSKNELEIVPCKNSHQTFFNKKTPLSTEKAKKLDIKLDDNLESFNLDFTVKHFFDEELSSKSNTNLFPSLLKIYFYDNKKVMIGLIILSSEALKDEFTYRQDIVIATNKKSFSENRLTYSARNKFDALGNLECFGEVSKTFKHTQENGSMSQSLIDEKLKLDLTISKERPSCKFNISMEKDGAVVLKIGEDFNIRVTDTSILNLKKHDLAELHIDFGKKSLSNPYFIGTTISKVIINQPYNLNL